MSLFDLAGADVIILMFDISNEDSFRDLDTIWMKLIKGSVYPQALPSNKHMLLVGNKADLEAQRKVQNADAMTFAEEIEAGYIEISAKTELNVDELLRSLALKFYHNTN